MAVETIKVLAAPVNIKVLEDKMDELKADMEILKTDITQIKENTKKEML